METTLAGRQGSTWVQLSMHLHASLCMRRCGRFDLPGELAPIVRPALVVPVPRDIPTEGGTSRCDSEPFHQYLECTSSGIGPGCCSSEAAASELPLCVVHQQQVGAFSGNLGTYCSHVCFLSRHIQLPCTASCFPSSLQTTIAIAPYGHTQHEAHCS